jgi:hypothetical protein
VQGYARHALRTLDTEARLRLPLYLHLEVMPPATGLKRLRPFSNKTRGPSCYLMVSLIFYRIEISIPEIITCIYMFF